MRKLHASWKKKLSCGGEHTVTADTGHKMTFQGDHSREVYKWIMDLGYTRDRILMAGTGK